MSGISSKPQLMIRLMGNERWEKFRMIIKWFAGCFRTKFDKSLIKVEGCRGSMKDKLTASWTRGKCDEMFQPLCAVALVRGRCSWKRRASGWIVEWNVNCLIELLTLFEDELCLWKFSALCDRNRPSWLKIWRRKNVKISLGTKNFCLLSQLPIEGLLNAN